MTYCYTTLNKPLRQTEKQRESSLIAERKFLKRIFKIIDDTIVIQYYYYKNGFHLVEKRGIVHSDSTFTFKEYYDYRTKNTKIIDEYYKFQFSDKL